jgi:citrate synthase
MSNSKPHLDVTDSRTGKSYKVPISENNTINATEFQKIQGGITVFDPSFNNTAVAESKITYIDGDRGVLSYRGYSIEELAEKSSFLEVAFLLIYGELPTKEQFEDWHKKVSTNNIDDR